MADEEEPATWRLIITDSESQSGVAPICNLPDVHAMMRGGHPGDFDVFAECCPGPHLECNSPQGARQLLAVLNAHGVTVCD
jgi:hypothetical protein